MKWLARSRCVERTVEELSLRDPIMSRVESFKELLRLHERFWITSRPARIMGSDIYWRVRRAVDRAVHARLEMEGK